jgi:hypothetical protein
MLAYQAYQAKSKNPTNLILVYQAYLAYQA